MDEKPDDWQSQHGAVALLLCLLTLPLFLVWTESSVMRVLVQILFGAMLIASLTFSALSILRGSCVFLGVIAAILSTCLILLIFSSVKRQNTRTVTEITGHSAPVKVGVKQGASQ